MAAYSHSRVSSRTSLFNGGGLGEQELPSGSCNFRDLNTGARATQCGCQRFWLNNTHISHQDAGSDRAWCFCGHHACFHNAFSQQQRALEQPMASCQAVDVQEQGDDNKIVYDGDNVHVQRAASTPLKPPTGLGIRPDSRSQPSSINARVWQALNDFARNQEDGGMSDAASKLPSTAAPSVIDEPNLSPNRIIQDRVQQYRPMAPPVNIPSNFTPRPPEEYSATEVATPSVQGTPDFQALASSSNNTRTSPGHLQPSRLESGRQHLQSSAQLSNITRPNTAMVQHQAVATSAPMDEPDIQSTLRAYCRRLEVLESLSFSHVPVEEIQERFELIDGRVLDLEEWRTDSDRNYISSEPSKSSSSKRRRLLPTETGSFGSDGSFDVSAAAHTEAAVLATLAVNEETRPKFEALEERVSDLERAALPSFARPWHVQVVLLPWGPGLKGIWFSSIEATQHSLHSATQASEEWTGAQSAPKLSFKSSANGAWTTESIQAWADEAHEWLSPKACGPNGTVFQRLASRGLVRDVTLTAPDSRHMFDAIANAFDEVGSIDPELYNEQTLRFQGLREPLIPLRKVRKSSRLRFLSPAEMVTSATWTATFLDSSIFMKVNDGQRRLYVTTPEAYIQPGNEDWTWSKIRELPVFEASTGEQAAQAANVAIETCWSFHEQFDHHISEHASFASHESQWSTRSQIAEQDMELHQRQPISPRSEAILPRQRTTSLPSSMSAAEQAKESLPPKRRVASFETAKTINTMANESGAAVIAKRRRISKSPEAERRGVNFTPRWSCEPPSPFTTEAIAESRSQGTSSRKRGTTPFDMPYATPHSKPHSNSDYVVRMEFIAGDGDTEADTEIVADHSERVEDEWEGVEDGNTNLDDSDRDSAVDEADVDEGHLDEA